MVTGTGFGVAAASGTRRGEDLEGVEAEGGNESRLPLGAALEKALHHVEGRRSAEGVPPRLVDPCPVDEADLDGGVHEVGPATKERGKLLCGPHLHRFDGGGARVAGIVESGHEASR